MIRNIFKFLFSYINIIIWVSFFFIYLEASRFFHTFDLTGFSYSYKVGYHIAFFIPLGIFLWRREYRIRNVIIVLLLLSAAPEAYQQYFREGTWEMNLLDFVINISGCVVGIFVGMLWTFRELVTK